jgi:transcriptional regulator, propionate catabolism operon regulatory protein
MKDSKIQIGLIHASEELINDALRLAKQKDYILLAEPFCIDAAVPVGKRMVEDGIDVIISRRYTASVLRKHLNIPVLAVPVTSFDVFQCLWRAAKKWKTILFPIFNGSPESKRIVELKSMIGADILCYEYDTTKQMETAILWGSQKGCQGVVGGPITKSLAAKLSMECEEITCNRESLEFTLQEAYWVAINRKKEKEQNQLYRTIVNMGSKGVIAVDQGGFIKIFNNLANDKLKIKENPREPKNIKDVLPIEEVLHSIHQGLPLNYHVGKIGNRQYLVDYIPAELEKKIIGGVITLQDTDSVIKAESEIRRSMVRGLVAKYAIDDFIYIDPETEKLINNTKKYAARDSTILITGPTGTGKEIIAHGIHQLSKRKLGPFVSINCASIPEQLLESELFGHEEGSFTGARRGGKQGLFELAHKGTIFLDEIGSMPLSLQGRFLRVLQEREVMRVGGDRLTPIDVRVLAATNEDLRQKVMDGNFREDLFFRINVLSLKIPPLSKRVQDIPCLVRKIVEQLSRQHNLPILRIPDHHLEELICLSWPGNVRQLHNFLERLIILCEGKFSDDIFRIQYEELLSYSKINTSKNSAPEGDSETVQTVRQNSMAVEKNYIIKILQECKYNKNAAAQRLGISRVTLWRKLKKEFN